MSNKAKSPVPSEEPTMCAVCAWRLDCKKKYSYEQGGTIKCPDYTRDAGLPEPEEEN